VLFVHSEAALKIIIKQQQQPVNETVSKGSQKFSHESVASQQLNVSKAFQRGMRKECSFLSESFYIPAKRERKNPDD
jgi:hypothetical protein